MLKILPDLVLFCFDFASDFPERQISDDTSVFTDASGSDQADQQTNSDVDETFSQLTKSPVAMVSR